MNRQLPVIKKVEELCKSSSLLFYTSSFITF